MLSETGCYKRYYCALSGILFPQSRNVEDSPKKTEDNKYIKAILKEGAKQKFT